MKTIITALILCIVVGVVCYFYGAKHSYGHKYTCRDFKTQPTAQKAYNNGAKYLDGSDHDGIPCESLPIQ